MINTKFSSKEYADRFVGIVKNAEIRNVDDYGNRLYITIVDSSGNERELFYAISTARKSKLGQLVHALKKIGIDDWEEKDLIGKKFIWERQDMEFEDEVGEKRTSFYFIPVAIADDKQKQTSIDWSELDTQLKTGLSQKQIQRIGKKLGATIAEINEHMKALDESGKLSKDGEEFILGE